MSTYYNIIQTNVTRNKYLYQPFLSFLFRQSNQRRQEHTEVLLLYLLLDCCSL